MANVQSTVYALAGPYLEAASASSAADDLRRCRLLRWILKLGTENQRGENQVA